MIEDQEEKALIALGEEHLKLVETLRKALLLGQMGFLKAGQTLTVIKEKKSYRGEDLQHEWTWVDFCARPDLPIPGRTYESRRRTADALIRVYKVFIKRLSYSKDSLAPIGWTKLDLIAPLCENEEDKSKVQDWVDRATNLTVSNLLAEIKEKDSDAFEKLSCRHENEYPIFYCPNCGVRSKHPLNKKHKEISESSWK